MRNEMYIIANRLEAYRNCDGHSQCDTGRISTDGWVIVVHKPANVKLAAELHLAIALADKPQTLPMHAIPVRRRQAAVLGAAKLAGVSPLRDAALPQRTCDNDESSCAFHRQRAELNNLLFFFVFCFFFLVVCLFGNNGRGHKAAGERAVF